MKLVSAIMPTRGRPELAKRALDSYLNQTYSEKQLLIYDDDDRPSFPVEPKYQGVLYFRNHTPRNIPQKRNALCRLADGSIIVHFDSDDISHPWRIQDQVDRLEESGKSVTGYNSILFYEPETKTWGRYVGDPYYALGTSLCYYRAWWKAHPFNESLVIGEDNDFLFNQEHGAIRLGEMISSDGSSMIVALVHLDNTSKKDMGNCRPIEQFRIPPELELCLQS